MSGYRRPASWGNGVLEHWPLKMPGPGSTTSAVSCEEIEAWKSGSIIRECPAFLARISEITCEKLIHRLFSCDPASPDYSQIRRTACLECQGRHAESG